MHLYGSQTSLLLSSTIGVSTSFSRSTARF
jgi:hypothetical protein